MQPTPYKYPSLSLLVFSRVLFFTNGIVEGDPFIGIKVYLRVFEVLFSIKHAPKLATQNSLSTIDSKDASSFQEVQL